MSYRGTTSGSSGQPHVYFGCEAWDKQRVLGRDRSLAWWGISAAVPIVNLFSRLWPARPNDFAVGVVDPKTLSFLLQKIAGVNGSPGKFREIALRGYPSRLVQAALVWEELPQGQRPPVRAVIATGEVLHSFQRERLAQVFSAPVVEEYGCHDAGIAGMSCPEYGTLHLDTHRTLIEVDQGILITTDLYNTAFPVIRYACGDLIEILPSCPCGRPGMSAKIFGRRGDLIPAGERLWSPGELALGGVPSLRDLRLTATPNGIVLSDPTGGASTECMAPLVVALEAQVGAPVQFRALAPPNNRGTKEANLTRDEFIAKVCLGEWGEGAWLDRAPTELATEAALLGEGLRPRAIDAHGNPVPRAEPSAPFPADPFAARIRLWAVARLRDGNRDRDQHAAALAENIAQSLQCSEDSEALRTDLAIHHALLGDPQRFKPKHVGPLDALSCQHLLAAVESAWGFENNPRSDSPTHRLAPLLPVLLADVMCFAGDWGAWLLAVLARTLGRPPLQTTAPSEWTRAWSHQRALWWDLDRLDTKLVTLREMAENPQEHLQCELETLYAMVLKAELGNPVDLFERTAKLINNPLLTDALPLVPVLQALAGPLSAAGRPDLSYHCLVVATTPSSRQSASARASETGCSKQRVVASDVSMTRTVAGRCHLVVEE